VSRRRVVVSEKANTHARPTRDPLPPPVPISIQVWMAASLMIRPSSWHTFTFHYKLPGATNINYDEVLTAPGHLPVQKLVLYYPRPSTDLCTYKLMTLTV